MAKGTFCVGFFWMIKPIASIHSVNLSSLLVVTSPSAMFIRVVAPRSLSLCCILRGNSWKVLHALLPTPKIVNLQCEHYCFI
jgi:hypothetical protein